MRHKVRSCGGTSKDGGVGLLSGVGLFTATGVKVH
jgi:hypothetical protein